MLVGHVAKFSKCLECFGKSPHHRLVTPRNGECIHPLHVLGRHIRLWLVICTRM